MWTMTVGSPSTYTVDYNQKLVIESIYITWTGLVEQWLGVSMNSCFVPGDGVVGPNFGTSQICAAMGFNTPAAANAA